MRKPLDPALEAAHKHATGHRDVLDRSTVCGWFYCLETFPPSAVREWIDDDRTALCPHCGIDAVIGDASGLSVDELFLCRMNHYWFEPWS